MKRICQMCRMSFDAKRRSALTCSDTCRQKRSRLVRKVTPELPAGPFDLVYADPALGFDSRTPAGQERSPSRHYQTFDHTVWERLQVSRIVPPNALLALWVYNVRLFEADELAAAWGFPHYSGVLFTLVKRTKARSPAMGSGYSTRKGTEQCLLFKRGTGLTRRDKGVPEVIETEEEIEPEIIETAWRREPHSTKPVEAMVRLERLYGDVRRIELFARRYRFGWIGWGNQYVRDDKAIIESAADILVV